MTSDIKDFIIAVKAMSEMLAIHRDSLILNGFTRKEAVELCKSLQAELIGNSRTGGENNE